MKLFVLDCDEINTSEGQLTLKVLPYGITEENGKDLELLHIALAHDAREVFIESSPPTISYPVVLDSVQETFRKSDDDKKIAKVERLMKDEDGPTYTLVLSVEVEEDEEWDRRFAADLIRTSLETRLLVDTDGVTKCIALTQNQTSSQEVKLFHVHVVVGAEALTDILIERGHIEYGNLELQHFFNTANSGSRNLAIDPNKKHLWEKEFNKCFEHMKKENCTYVGVVNVTYVMPYVDILKSRRKVQEVITGGIDVLPSNIVFLNKNKLSEL